MTASGIFDVLLRLAGAGHFVVLVASAQVPARLRWREELVALSPLNRKFMWVQGAFTVLTIVAFGALTLALRGELLRGDRAAVALAAFIAVYWTARIGVDAFVFVHADWPPGRWLAIGHVLLTALFVALAGTYAGLVLWHVSA